MAPFIEAMKTSGILERTNLVGAQLWVSAGTSFGVQGRLEFASEAFSLATKKAGQTSRTWYQQATAQAAIGATNSYRESCREQLAHFGQTTDTATANYLAWICAIRPEAVSDYAPVLALATRATEAAPKDPGRLNTLAAVLFRAGRLQEARAKLQEAAQIRAGAFDVWNALILAMIHQRLGEKEEAQAHLKAARAWHERPENTASMSWESKASLNLLLKEAGEMAGLK